MANQPLSSRELLRRYRGGRDEAATALFDRYVARLTALARSRIAPKLRRRLDPEDVVQSAYRSFFLRARHGAYELGESGDLWRLLAGITLHKLHRQIEKHTAAKRSIARETPSDESVADLTGPEPSAAEVIALCEGARLAILGLSPEERWVLSLTLEGRSIPEISSALGKSQRTARRILATVKRTLERQLLNDDPARPAGPRPSGEPHAPLLYSDYVLERLLGSGGMGKVFRARDRRTGQVVAIKALHKARQKDERAVALVVQEAQILARLRHPNIVQVQGLGRFPGGGYFLAMEFVDGQDLQTRLEGRPLPLSEVARIAMDVASALQHAHDEGVVHCDLKPANVLLDDQGQVRVTDFGFAHLLADASASARIALGGTEGYIAPEVLLGQGLPTPAADVYAFGVLLWRLATGSPAIECDSSSTDDALAAMRSICRRCTLEAPQARYRTMRELAGDLETFALSERRSGNDERALIPEAH